MNKRSYLLAGASELRMEAISSFYDEREQMTMIDKVDGRVPLVGDDLFVRTTSKTAQAPGDDDPDPEDEGCY